ncbi:divalent-cation tolerance protein CutA [Candidatus Gottesmanbacteria bacterium]|nr:divalent-cation tolerance protein CutA [Candidatus Gottesmanbacteria bacterium]
MTDMILVYVTCTSLTEAKKIGKRLLEKRLCGCVNFVENANPMFLWPPKSGKINESQETILLVKTLENKYDLVEAEVVKLHSYDTPCIIGIPIAYVSRKYLHWLAGELE